MCSDGPQTTRTLAVYKQSDEKCIMTILKETEFFNYDGKGLDFDHEERYSGRETGFRYSLNSIRVSSIVRDVDCFTEPQCT